VTRLAAIKQDLALPDDAERSASLDDGTDRPFVLEIAGSAIHAGERLAEALRGADTAGLISLAMLGDVRLALEEFEEEVRAGALDIGDPAE
jgi:hypothetical protein